MTSLAFAAVILRSRGPVAWHPITLLVALLCVVPWLQYGLGLVTMAGTAWITSAYLLGLLLTLLMGARWEANSPGQLADGLFLAIGVAALLSVGLQLQQWLQLDGLPLWTMGGGQARPHANFGQPNQLATFLLWGLLAVAWGVIRGSIGGRTALLMALYLLFGLALTLSRTAWIAVVLLVVSSWLWRRLWSDPRGPWVVTGLGLYFLACVVGASWVLHASQGNLQADLDGYTRMSSELRPMVWTAFVDAAWREPLRGYGWGQVVLAQLAVATDHPNLQGVYSYSHNLFLDLVLWCGIPLGLFVSVALLGWFWRRLRAVDSAENAVLVLFLLVVANHAMLELPLYHAYLLLPAGMVMGVLNTRLGARPLLQTGRWALVLLWLLASTLLALIVRDYVHAEESYQNLRMEWSGIKLKTPASPPEVLLLTQWGDYIRYARIAPRIGLSQDELDWMRNVTGMFPSVFYLHKLATALALNQHPDEAALWLKRICKVASETQCLAAKAAWAKQAVNSPEIAAVPWPGQNKN